MDDDIQFTEDLGLVVSGEMGLEISNPIYREIVPRVLISTLEKQLRVTSAPYVAAERLRQGRRGGAAVRPTGRGLVVSGRELSPRDGIRRGSRSPDATAAAHTRGHGVGIGDRGTG
ncbi:MAG: hypothetical protein GY856_42535 [bacterium]|nr:hypothetical protein [bacterium]